MVFEKELYLAQTEGKPPFFGIAYPEYADGFGSHDNTHLLNHNIEINLLLYFEPDKLKILVETIGFYHLYGYHVNYDKRKLYEWLKQNKDSKKINFGHVSKKESGKIEVIRTHVDNKLFVKPVKNLYVMNFKDEGVIKMAVQ